MKPENIKAAHDLIKRYRSVTIDEIKSFWYLHEGAESGRNCAWAVAQMITGIASIDTCSLCIAVEMDCHKCIYMGRVNCTRSSHKDTYMSIMNATSPERLLNAFQDRADHIESYLKTL